jgi:hypothetical protein
MVAWDKVQHPLHLGGRGLGVPDLRLQGIALRTCWLWLRFSDSSRPWASLIGGEDMLTTTFFRSSVQFQLGDGAILQF